VNLSALSTPSLGSVLAEPVRVILDLEVKDAQTTAQHLDAMSVTWLAPLEYREPAGACFGRPRHGWRTEAH